jgi:hypothetical protein
MWLGLGGMSKTFLYTIGKLRRYLLTSQLRNRLTIHHALYDIALGESKDLIQMPLTIGLCQELLDAFSKAAVESQIGARPINVLCRQFAQHRGCVEIYLNLQAKAPASMRLKQPRWPSGRGLHAPRDTRRKHQVQADALAEGRRGSVPGLL